MDFLRWRTLKSWLALPSMPSLDQRQREWRIFISERDIGLPVKAIVLLSLFYFFYWSTWSTESQYRPEVGLEEAAWSLAHRFVQYSFIAYVAINIGVAFILMGMRQVSRPTVEWTVFAIASIDSLFLSALLAVTGGLSSSLFWLYPLLVLRNTVSVAALIPQVALNLLLCLFFSVAVLVEASLAKADAANAIEGSPGLTFEWVNWSALGTPFYLRLALLIGVAAWAYGFQVLLDRQRRKVEEQSELALRREQLEVSGKLAAEIAHQLKNPLAIINNASFTLQRTVREGKTITQQIQIIREEVARSDRLITELMGYSKLSEGKVEKLDVKEEMERALLEVFPPAVKFEVVIHRDYDDALPSLLLQRGHLAEILVNLMQNAREAMGGRGNLWVSARHGDDYSIMVTIEDDGPGIAPEIQERIFESYFTTREKGSGLGLAIVKHNTELYGGRIHLESELGKGSRFLLQFPARTLIRLRR